MKLKKAISALAALAISASCFAGLTLTANAATTVDIGTLSTDIFTGANIGNITKTDYTDDNIGGVQLALNSGQNDRYGHWIFSNTTDKDTDKLVKLSYDMQIKGGTQNQTKVSFVRRVKVSNGNGGDNGMNNPIITVAADKNSGKVYFEGKEITDALSIANNRTGWFNVTAYVDFENNKINAVVKDKKTGNTHDEVVLEDLNLAGQATGVNDVVAGLTIGCGRYTSEVAVANVSVGTGLSVPTFTLSTESAEDYAEQVNLTDTYNVDVTEIANASSLTAESSDESVATATYDESTQKVVVTGKTEGVITISVRGYSSDGNWVKKTFTFNNGAKKTHVINVKYVKEGTTEPELYDARTIPTAVEGETVTLSDLLADEAKDLNVLYNGASATAATKKYTFKDFKASTGVLTGETYEIPATNGAAETIYVEYDEIDKVTTINLLYKAGDETIKTVPNEVNDKYVGESYSYSYPKYFAGDDNKVTHSYAGTDALYTKSSTVPADGNLSVDYTKYNDKSWFWDFNGASSNSGGVNAKLSGGSGMATPDGKSVLATVPESGVYSVSLLAYNGNTQTQFREATAIVFKNNAKVDGQDVPESDIILQTAAVGTKAAAYVTDDYITTEEDVELSKGETIYIVTKAGSSEGQQSRVGVDYLLLTKTGDLDPIVEPGDSKIAVETTFVVASPTFDTFKDGNKFYTAAVEKVISIPVKYASAANTPELYIHNEKVNVGDWGYAYDDATEVGTYYLKFTAPTADGLKELDDAYIVCGKEATEGDKSNQFALKTLLDSATLSNAE